MTTTMNNRMEQINLLLNPDGISVQWTEKFKNNGRKKGLLVHSGEKNCSPILYVDEDFWEKSDTDIVEFLKDAYENHSCQINTDEFLSRESILAKVLLKIGEELGEKYVILPSSVHECICVPFESEGSLSSFGQMVREINQSQVLPEDRLTDSVYLCNQGVLSLVE